MFSVNVNFRNPVNNFLLTTALRLPDPRGIVEWITLMRVCAMHPYQSILPWEASSIDRLEARVVQRMVKAREYVASYFAKERAPIAPERPPFDPVACEEPIVKDAFYNKNMCTAHQVSSKEKESYAKLVDSAKTGSLKSMAKLEKLWKKRDYDFSGPGVFAKLENSNRCTLDGHEEQVVVMCNQHGHTNSTMPRPGIDVVKDVYSRLDKCVDEFLKLL